MNQVWAYRRECLEAGSSMDGCGPLRRVESAQQWLEVIRSYTDPSTLPEGCVLATQFLAVRESDDKVVAMIQIRLYFNTYLEKYAGHIGYSTRPSERRRGYAKEQLRQALSYCKKLGMGKVLISCKSDNPGSRRTILANGGVYESTVHEPNQDIYLERYWIIL